MTKGFALSLAVAIAAALLLAPAAALGDPTDGEIDISGVELAGSSGGVNINVFGTLRCAGAGPLQLDVTVTQPSTGGLAAGGQNGQTCPEAGALVKWVVTATGTGFVVGDKVNVEAVAAGSTIATDSEEHVLRWGR